MYEIILKTWYQETPEIEYDEVYNNMRFLTIEEACNFLGENHEEILDNFPVLEITIKYNLKWKNVNIVE